MSQYMGIDVGGTKIAAGLLDTNSQQLHGEIIVPTITRANADAVLQQIADLVRQVCHDTSVPLPQVAGVGIAMPATIDFKKGRTLLLPNIQGDWWQKPVVDILRTDLGRPVALVNDARAFTLAEALWGAGRGYASVVGMTLGTGIGGGIVIDGKLYLGLGGSAGEIGHHSIDLNGVPDGTGTPGALEAYGSGPAIAAMGVKAVMQGINTLIDGLADHDLNAITPHIIMQAAEQDDAIAQAILYRAGTSIGAGMANIVTIVAPHCIVIGGGLTQLGDWLMKPMLESLRARCHTVNMDELAIKSAALGAQAGIIGAALQVSQSRGSAVKK